MLRFGVAMRLTHKSSPLVTNCTETALLFRESVTRVSQDTAIISTRAEVQKQEQGTTLKGDGHGRTTGTFLATQLAFCGSAPCTTHPTTRSGRHGYSLWFGRHLRFATRASHSARADRPKYSRSRVHHVGKPVGDQSAQRAVCDLSFTRSK